MVLCPLDWRVFLTCKTPAFCDTSDNNKSNKNKYKKRNDGDCYDGDDAETGSCLRIKKGKFDLVFGLKFKFINKNQRFGTSDKKSKKDCSKNSHQQLPAIPRF